MPDYKGNLKSQFDDFATQQKMSAEYKRKKLINYAIRTIFTIVLYILFWKYTWVKWTLLFYIPLSLFNLIVLLGYNSWVDKKAKKMRNKIDK